MRLTVPTFVLFFKVAVIPKCFGRGATAALRQTQPLQSLSACFASSCPPSANAPGCLLCRHLSTHQCGPWDPSTRSTQRKVTLPMQGYAENADTATPSKLCTFRAPASTKHPSQITNAKYMVNNADQVGSSLMHMHMHLLHSGCKLFPENFLTSS